MNILYTYLYLQPVFLQVEKCAQQDNPQELYAI